MGSFFSSPSPPPAPIVIRQSEPVEVVKTEIKTNSDDVEAKDAAKKTATLGRNRRGLVDNISTSWTGVLSENPFSLQRKNLLGE